MQDSDGGEDSEENEEGNEENGEIDGNEDDNEDEENDENEEKSGEKSQTPWKPLPTLEEEREEQAKERMMEQAKNELRLKTPINNKQVLFRKLLQIYWQDNDCSLVNPLLPITSPLPPSSSSQKEEREKKNGQQWLKHQAVLSSTSTSLSIPNIEDDLQRELAFYNQAKEAVEHSWNLFNQLEVKNERPEDYFAEMLKSDYHMSNVRGRLIREKRELEAKEQRRHQRMMKKMGKQTQKQKQLERQQEKKENPLSLREMEEKNKNGKRQIVS